MRRIDRTTGHNSHPGSRSIHRLMDEVYREMYLLEAGRPGAEMGLALALLRAGVAADRESEESKDWGWLKAVSPICLKMIEESLDRGGTVAPLVRSSSTAVPES